MYTDVQEQQKLLMQFSHLDLNKVDLLQWCVWGGGQGEDLVSPVLGFYCRVYKVKLVLSVGPPMVFQFLLIF
jgi:hypothetical protein